MIVTKENMLSICQRLCSAGEYGLDTETTGLGQDDSIFSIIISTEDNTYYFNLQEYEDVIPLNRFDVFKYLKPVFENPYTTWFIQNAKFDWRMLSKEGLEIHGKVHCTYAVERLIKNNYFGKEAYSLSALAKRRGLEKDDAVDRYITEHKLWTPVTMPGKKKIIKKLHFDKVPFEIISKYGEKDGYLHRYIGLDQCKQLAELEASKPENHPSFYPVVENEIRLTKTCFNMERTGIKINRKFISTALEYELNQIKKYKKEFAEFTGEEFVDSNKPLQKVFDKLGESYPLTEKNNPSFAADVLEEMTTPVAAMVNKIRYHDKRAGTYYSSFLYYATKEDLIHADARQAGTESGRMSYRDPNLQNIPKESDDEDLKTPYHIRESFIPLPGKLFYDVDYRQLEYCLMMDYAGEHKIIERINAGEDFHEAIACEVGITRKQAKTLNFALGYGAGAGKIAKMLNIPLREAQDLKYTYFGRLPKYERFLKTVADTARARGFVYNWLGRRNYLDNPEFSYAIPNHLIQGSAADVVKVAMNRIHDYLQGHKIDFKMILQVHDEILFQLDPRFSEAIIDVRFIMENTYVGKNGVRLSTNLTHSFKNWGSRNLVEGVYSG